MRQDINLLVGALAEAMVLGAVLDTLRETCGTYELVAHWKQGEFHHDVVVRVENFILVIATNCNGGVKEVLCFEQLPERFALWRWRCPHVHDFSGELPSLVAYAQTHHWFDPCELLADNARSELREEFREREVGGGWVLSPQGCGARRGER